jgi:hypothetical protein
MPSQCTGGYNRGEWPEHASTGMAWLGLRGKNDKAHCSVNGLNMNCRVEGARILFFKHLHAVGAPLSICNLWITRGARKWVFRSRASAG